MVVEAGRDVVGWWRQQWLAAMWLAVRVSKSFFIYLFIIFLIKSDGFGGDGYE